ncbi:MAG: hypothetical protein JW892_02940 [Anaerolineae bacterium]|nr:hypothetical protein [Anaerolineae bacterium]
MKRSTLFKLSVVVLLTLFLGGGLLSSRRNQAQGLAFQQAPPPMEVYPAEVQPMGESLTNEFTYQGRLTDNGGAPVTGPCAFRFSLYESSAGDDPIGNIQTVANVPLNDGYFSVHLDFGLGVFTGDGRFMKVEVDCGAGVYTTLSPRVRLTPAPYALHAVSTGALHGNPVSDSPPDPGDVLTWDGGSWLPLASEGGAQVENVIVVAKSGGDFTSIQEALDSITDAADTNPFLVWVAPGRYVERVTMKPYVDIEGAGESSTIIMYPGSTILEFAGTVVGADDAALRSLTVINTGGGNYAVAILNSNASPKILHVTAYADRAYVKNIGVLNENQANPVMTHVTAIASGSDTTDNVGIENSTAFPTLIQVEARATGGYISSGIRNATGASPLLDGVTASGSSAQITFGVHNVDAGAQIENSTITVSAGTQQCGIFNEWDDISGVYVVTLENSQIRVADNIQPTVRSDDNFAVYVATSRLHGGSVDTSAGGTVRCFACYDRQFENLGGIGACP